MELYSALPGYPGGKRRLLPLLYGLVQSEHPAASWQHLRFADPFLGGGAVSLWAKSNGFESVSANDIAERSAVIGRALIANSTERLNMADVVQLLQGSPSPSRAALADRVEAPLVADFLSSARLVLDTHPGVKRDLMTLLLLHVAVHYFPMGLPTASDAKYIADGDFDHVSGPRLKHYLHDGRRLVTPASLLKTAADINAAILPGKGSVTKLDAFDFLPGIDADIVYLDPPYAGTQSYEKVFALLDDFIGAEPLAVSPFSARKAPLDDLLDACNHIPTVVLSLNNAVLDEEALTTLVARHRKVARVLSIPYRHYAAVATARKNADNREFMILATKERSR